MSHARDPAMNMWEKPWSSGRNGMIRNSPGMVFVLVRRAVPGCWTDAHLSHSKIFWILTSGIATTENKSKCEAVRTRNHCDTLSTLQFAGFLSPAATGRYCWPRAKTTEGCLTDVFVFGIITRMDK